MAGHKGLVTVFGGSGFVGRAVVRSLAKAGYRVRVAVRRPDLAGFLQPLGAVGQIQAVQANLRYPASVKAAAAGSDIVINCVGILAEGGNQRFLAVQAQGAKHVAEAAREVSARLIHVSAIGADAQSASAYARSKAQGEAAVRAAVPDAIILRPSIIFGQDDSFFNRFAGLSTVSPVLPLIGGGETLFQPVYVGDVAEAVLIAADGCAKPGTTYELGGPQQSSFRSLLETLCEVTGRKPLLLPVPFFAAQIMGRILGLLPNPQLTEDQVELLKSDNVVSEEAVKDQRTLEGLGITPKSVASIIPTYLWRFRKTGQFAANRA